MSESSRARDVAINIIGHHNDDLALEWITAEIEDFEKEVKRKPIFTKPKEYEAEEWTVQEIITDMNLRISSLKERVEKLRGQRDKVKRETVEACIKAVEETRPFTQSSLCIDLERKEIFRALEKLLEEP